VGIEAGKQLLHYRLTEKIGEGGMGVVWRALDTTLDREVAIKILPDSLAQETERLARFEREAKLLASLNHSNIAAVYSVHTDQGQHFLAMELVEGEDLSTRLQRGPLSVEQALAYAGQIADALEAAHEKGVVHRDLKPANLRITSEGNVKVLDFGLAKAFAADSESSEADPSFSPTITSAGTRAGVILGTAAYMSPEQAKGYPVDSRADIWAFGAVLFEMLTGTQAFKGATVSELLASVLRDTPDLDRLPRALPRNVRRLIYAGAASGNLDVYLLRVGGDRAINLTAGSPDDDSQAKFSPDGESIVFRSERDDGGLFTMGATGESVRRVTDFGMDPCWSPDGRQLAFGTEAVDDPYSRAVLSTLWTVELETGQTKQLTVTGDAVQPAWSPDGSRTAYWANTGGQRDIWMIAANGGDPVAVTQDRFTDWSPVWSPDGRWLYFSSDRGGSMNLWRLPVDANGELGTDAQPVTSCVRSPTSTISTVGSSHPTARSWC